MSLEVTYMGSTGVHLRRPFPKFGGFQVMNAPGPSSYHALQLRLEYRFSNGFTLPGSYAWSKSIDNGSGVRSTEGDP
ncbi:MAG: hypothetical protein B7X34_08080, partial [Acidobacteriia bacterium 12-62-4]